MSHPLLAEIREFLVETGMSEFRFGFKACKNGRLVEQLEGRTPQRKTGAKAPKKYGWVRPETEMKVRAFMLVERERRVEPKRARAS